MLYAVGLIALFTIGGISGIMHSSPPADLQQTDSYFVVAHFHYVLYGGAIFGIFAGIYHYFPKMTGRFLDEGLGKAHFWLNFVGMNLTFFPMHYAGLLGMPRRIYTYDAGQGWDTFNLLSTAGTAILLGSGLVFAWNFFRSYRHGAPAGPNPWDAATLEWSIPSPPPEYNFAQLPTVTSRYPLWDMTHPEMTESLHIETERRTAKELGIPMPLPTIKPLLTALAMMVMFTGPLLLGGENKLPAIALMVAGGLGTLLMLYAWLYSPLEGDEAH
jgi:cytochrome c oxidase subunit 1